jgi:hypothetical protein
MAQQSASSSQSGPNAAIAAAIREHLTDGNLPCADAFAVAAKERVTARSVGEAADMLSIRLARCQLGLFGYPGKKGWVGAGVTVLAVPEGLEAAITAARDPDGHLTCVAAWRLADRFGTSRMQVGWIAEQMAVKIVSCQLGAF